VPTYLSILAEAYARDERPQEALAVVDEALAMAEQTGSHYWDAELRRLEGTLLPSASSEPDAEARFSTAIEIARRQKARSLELRATVDLCRLWAARGKTREARARLAEVYDGFTEGFDTADLTDAKALLDELAERDGAGSPGSPNRKPPRRGRRSSAA
jgi:adenylate cyclase